VATNQNIKDALSFVAEANNPIIIQGRTVGNGGLTRFAAALDGFYGISKPISEGGLGRAATADDAARWLWRQAAGFTKHQERKVKEDTLTPESELEN